MSAPSQILPVAIPQPEQQKTPLERSKVWDKAIENGMSF